VRPIQVFTGPVGTFVAGFTFTPVGGSSALRQAVYRNSTGTLDFYYQITSVNFNGLTATSFAGLVTDVGIRTDDFDGSGNQGRNAVDFLPGAVVPGTISVLLQYGGGFNGIPFGEVGVVQAVFGLSSGTSATLVVKTNAVDFAYGNPPGDMAIFAESCVAYGGPGGGGSGDCYFPIAPTGCQVTWTSGLQKFPQYDAPAPADPLPHEPQNPPTLVNDTPQYFGYLPTPNQKPIFFLCSTLNSGCALTSVATALSSFPTAQIGQIQNPAALDAVLRQKGGYGQGFIDSTTDPDWCEYCPVKWALVLQGLDPLLWYSGADIDTGQLFDAENNAQETLDQYLQNHVCIDQDRVVLKLDETAVDENGTPNSTTSHHYVLVTGQQTPSNGSTDWTVFDPGWNPDHTSDTMPDLSTPSQNLGTLSGHMNGFYTNLSPTPTHPTPVPVHRTFQVSGVRVFGKLRPMVGEMAICANSPVELLVTDPQGLLLGNVTAGAPDVFQIPNGSYTRDFPLADDVGTGVAHGDPSGIKSLSIPGPVPGSYQLQVTGTAPGTFTLTLIYLASDGTSQSASFSGVTDTGATSEYQFTYSPIPGTNPVLTLVPSSQGSVPTAQITTTASGLAYSRVTQTFNGTVTIRNVSSAPISGPFQIVFTSLTAGVTLADATGTFAGNPFITVPLSGGLGPGQSTSVAVQFRNPANAAINFTPVVYSGSLN
jgi:hypothetical protein